MDPFKASHLGQGVKAECPAPFTCASYSREVLLGVASALAGVLKPPVSLQRSHDHRRRVGKGSAWGWLDEALALADVTSAAPRNEVPEKGSVAGSTAEPLPKTPRQLGARS